MQGTDMLGCAQTGTGKTAAFALPILQILSLSKTYDKKKKIRSLIVTPTRELALQIGESFRTYGRYTGLNQTVVFGGVNQIQQTSALKQRRGHPGGNTGQIARPDEPGLYHTQGCRDLCAG